MFPTLFKNAAATVRVPSVFIPFVGVAFVSSICTLSSTCPSMARQNLLENFLIEKNLPKRLCQTIDGHVLDSVQILDTNVGVVTASPRYLRRPTFLSKSVWLIFVN